MKNLPLIFSILFLNSFVFAQNENWKSLFNEENLDNWKQLGGVAKYKIEDNCIVGISTPNTPNSFLTTKETYDDFILELEVKMHRDLNSGIQIRSQSKADYYEGVVHGYQVELDPSRRKWAGGIYDESRRGWLFPLTENPKGQAAFQNGKWNKIRIQAIGNSIQTWVNGVQCSDLVDDVDSEGFIALQVHGIWRKEDAGKEVRWRNIQILTEDLENEKWENSPTIKEYNYIPNYLTNNELRTGWRLLFDGESTENWRSTQSERFPKTAWKIENNELQTIVLTNEHSDLISLQKFSNFELIVDFKFEKAGNSGIKYFIDSERLENKKEAIGLEFQILDDAHHPDAKQGVNGNRTLGSLYDLIRAENLSEPHNPKKRFFNGQWNRARILVKNGKVEHWLNNVKVVEYDRHSQVFRALIEKSKYADYENFGQFEEGHILLQHHGDFVRFRSVKIREF